MSLLSVEDVTKSFEGLTALDHVTFCVERGEIKGLVGPNGAGKTTLFNVITGVLSPEEGSVLFEERELLGLSTHHIASLGLIRTFQEAKVFADLTVLENTLMGGYRHFRSNSLQSMLRLPSFLQEERDARDRALRQLERVGLENHLDDPAGDLTAGQERLLQLARALMGDPKLLCLDEPAAGLNSRETNILGNVIHSIAEQYSVTILLIEHDMSLVMDVCNSVAVLNYGNLIADGTPEHVQTDEQVLEAYLGVE